MGCDVEASDSSISCLQQLMSRYQQADGTAVRLLRDCRTLLSVLYEGGRLVSPSQTQLKRIQARIVENLKPVRPLASSRFFLFACAIIFLSVVAIGATPSGMNGWSALSIVQRIAVFATLPAARPSWRFPWLGRWCLETNTC